MVRKRFFSTYISSPVVIQVLLSMTQVGLGAENSQTKSESLALSFTDLSVPQGL